MARKLIVLSLIALLGGVIIGLPAHAQEGGGCNIEAPAQSVEINMMGWSFPSLIFTQQSWKHAMRSKT